MQSSSKQEYITLYHSLTNNSDDIQEDVINAWMKCSQSEQIQLMQELVTRRSI